MRKVYWLLLLVFFCSQLCNAQKNKEITVGDETFTMVFVEGGTFTMGATVDQGSYCKSNEKPCHKVTLSDFYIGQTEVTQALWVAVMGYNPSARQEDMNCPVENVSWDACVEFINKLNEKTGMKFRLPTESEWEFAARGGNKSNWYKYSGSNNLDEVAWYDVSFPQPVAHKKPNELGIYDMTCNVAEWCSDYYKQWPQEFAVRPQTNPTGPEDRYVMWDGKSVKVIQPHVVRGCAFGFNIESAEERIRISVRGSSENAANSIGFRIAL